MSRGRGRDPSMQAMLTQIELMSRPHVIVDLHNPEINRMVQEFRRPKAKWERPLQHKWVQPYDLQDVTDKYAEAWSPMELFD